MEDMNIDFDKYFAAGEIMNPEFVQLKKKIDRIIEKEYRVIPWSDISNLTGSKYNEIYYFHPTILNLSTLRKRIDLLNLDKKNNDLEKGVINFYEKYVLVGENFKKLRGIVKKTTQKRAEVKERKQKELARACEIDPLTKALLKYHDDFVNAAAKAAGESYDKNKKYLEDNGGLENVAPYPKANIGSRERYMWEMEKREFYASFVKLTKEQFIDENRKAAHDEYIVWIYKMTTKIGKKILEASMTGNREDLSPWQSSSLRP